MAEQGRWSDERSGLGRDNGRSGSDFEDYGNRDDFGRNRQDFNRQEFSGRGNESRAGHDGDYAQGGQGDPRSLSYGNQGYGIPSDYNFRGRTMGGSDQGPYASGGLSSDYNPGSYSQNRFGRSQSGQYNPAQGGSYRGAYRGAYDRDSGSDRYQMSDGRRPEERSFWSQTRDEVSSWFGDDEARRRRQQDDLRAGEHRGRGPKGYVRSDERIREDVNDQMTEHGYLDASDIEVKVASAEVTLSGTVVRRDDKRLAEDLAEHVSGVKHVQNNLRVKDLAAATATSSAPAGARSQTLTN